jgi:uncharacterized membrane protein YgcG
MNYANRFLAATTLFGALGAVTLSAPRTQQQTKIPIRAVTAPLASTTEPFKQLGEGVARELPDGRLLVNSAADRVLVIYDVPLARATIVADTNGTALLYTYAPRVVSYLGDSTLMFDVQSGSLFLITPTGAMGRVMAPPTRAFIGFGPGGGIDSRGRLVFAQFGLGAPAPPCVPGAAVGSPAPPADSGVIVRADFVTRTVDTIARNRGPAGTPFEAVKNAECQVVSVKWSINPTLPSVDTWAMTSTGVLAIIRGFDYHMEFIYADGHKVTGPKMPFDWRRLTDADKQAKIDSARKVVDSLSAAGGYRARICGGNMVGLMMAPIAPGAGGGGAGGGGGDGARGGGGRGGGGGDPPAANDVDCKWIAMTPAFPALSEMPDYVPPIRQTVPKADTDGNVWILPTTSLAAKDGLLYDVVNPKGELVERVQLPPDRDILTFGRNGVLYLTRRDAPNKVFIERVKVLRK